MCLCREDTTQDNVCLKALILENVLNTHIIGAKSVENVLQTYEPPSWSSGRNPEISGNKKYSQFWRSKGLEFFSQSF